METQKLGASPPFLGFRVGLYGCVRGCMSTHQKGPIIYINKEG